MDSLGGNDTFKHPITNLKKHFGLVAKSYKCTQSMKVSMQSWNRNGNCKVKKINKKTIQFIEVFKHNWWDGCTWWFYRSSTHRM